MAYETAAEEKKDYASVIAAAPVHAYSGHLSEDTELKEKPDFIPTYRGIPRFEELSREEQRALIARDPDFGDVVCRCETVTRAEVKRALHNPPFS